MLPNCHAVCGYGGNYRDVLLKTSTEIPTLFLFVFLAFQVSVQVDGVLSRREAVPTRLLYCRRMFTGRKLGDSIDAGRPQDLLVRRSGPVACTETVSPLERPSGRDGGVRLVRSLLAQRQHAVSGQLWRRFLWNA
jgi:hypothetical protein